MASSLGIRLSEELDAAAEAAGIEYERQGPPARQQRPLPQESAEELKRQGNDWMQKNQCAKAINCYSMALRVLEHNPTQLEAQAALYTLVLSNRAQARINLHQYNFAVKDAERAVERNPDCPKAVYREGLAHAGLKNSQKATGCFLRAGELSPEDAGPARQLLKLLGGLRSDIEFMLQLLKRHLNYPKFQQLVAEHLFEVLTGAAQKKAQEAEIAKAKADAATARLRRSKQAQAAATSDSEFEAESGDSESEDTGSEAEELQDDEMNPFRCALRVTELLDCHGLPHLRRLASAEQPAVRQAGERLLQLVAEHHPEQIPTPQEE